ncbi:hypothetical protein SAMN05444921_13624 [Streptomyces wuyuanensis]|uniref:Uncharacterized protein n=1 Tax=Streptomyces wuyuanensis TaxID=1196353 RepID=A0A1H0DTW5_9ACTN|nr:hypothetical protein SAMN05444921_13624 [Streptomyces wuyuanensis]
MRRLRSKPSETPLLAQGEPIPSWGFRAALRPLCLAGLSVACAHPGMRAGRVAADCRSSCGSAPGRAGPRRVPPRARAGAGAEVLMEWMLGVTPACAGWSTTTRTSPSSGTSHPRVRGLEVPFEELPPVSAESPPLARAGFSPRHPLRLEPRVTPACAGFLRAQMLVDRRRRVTPAWAGRRAPSTKALPRPPSHPRLRESQRPYSASRVRAGVTLACASTTASQRTGCSSGTRPLHWYHVQSGPV